jgi:hypothetical protein
MISDGSEGRFRPYFAHSDKILSNYEQGNLSYHPHFLINEWVQNRSLFWIRLFLSGTLGKNLRKGSDHPPFSISYNFLETYVMVLLIRIEK